MLGRVWLFCSSLDRKVLWITLTSTISWIRRGVISSISALRLWHNSSDWEASGQVDSKSTVGWKVVNGTLPAFTLQDFFYSLQQGFFIMSYLILRQNKSTWNCVLREALILKKTVKKGAISPFWRPPPPPLNGSKGDICCLITDKSA